MAKKEDIEIKEYKWVIKDYDLLDENSRDIDLLNTEEHAKEYNAKLLEIKKSWIIGFIGDFWIWKSHFINQVKMFNQWSDEMNSFWFEFNAWKYPNRDDLRQNFILEFWIATGELEKIMSKIEKQGWKNKAKLLDVISKIPIPGIAILKEFDYFIDTDPLKNIREYQALFANLINERSENIVYIVIEDIDRSWDKGIFFLETLNNFLKTSSLNKKVIVITPVWSEIFHNTKSRISFMKAFDYFHMFPEIKYNFSNFVKKVFKEEYHKKIIWEFLEKISKHKSNFNIRIIKQCIREADLKFIQMKKTLPYIQFEIILMVELSHFFTEKIWETDHSLFNLYKNWSFVTKEIFIAFLISFIDNKNSIYTDWKELIWLPSNIEEIYFFNMTNESIKYVHIQREMYYLAINNIYLEWITEEEIDKQKEAVYNS